MTTRLDIIDESLVSIGALPLQAESAPGGDSRIKEYETIKDAILSSHPWTFCTPTRKLGRLTVEPVIAWSFAYALPTTMVGAPRAAYMSDACREPFLRWELTVIESGDTKTPVLATDAEHVWLAFTSSVGPAHWPGYIKQVIVRACSAQYALSVREDKGLHDTLLREVYGSETVPGEMGLLGQAKGFHDGAKPSQGIQIGRNPLIMVRR